MSFISSLHEDRLYIYNCPVSGWATANLLVYSHYVVNAKHQAGKLCISII